MFKGEKNMQSEIVQDILFEKRRHEYAAAKRSLFTSYVSQPKKEKTCTLVSFTKWHLGESHRELFMEKESDLQEGGYYLVLQGLGIAINPGKDFFSSFCKKGYTLQDIDIVIQTYSDPQITNQLLEIQEINQRANQKLIPYGEEPHLIRFFLHSEAFGHFTTRFRPTFRKERDSLFLLETFSQKEETLALGDGLELAFIRLEQDGYAVRISDKKEGHQIGYISHGGYRDALSDFFQPCTLVIAGIGKSSIEDLEKIALEKDSLGFFGIIKLLEGLENLDALLVSEFSKGLGDIRIELLHKIQSTLDNGPKLLPLDDSFVLDLETNAVRLENGSFSLLRDVRSIRPYGSFSKILYVSNEDLL